VDLLAATEGAAPAGAAAVLLTGFVLGLRHGVDWDHIAAIADITSTSTVAADAEERHEMVDRDATGHRHAHGGESEASVHRHEPSPGVAVPASAPVGRSFRWSLGLGTLYALGHAFVVVVLGLLALSIGARLPDWVDPIMGRVVGLTLVGLGIYLVISLITYARVGGEFRLRSRWMLVFSGARHLWRRIQARVHGHQHVDPVEAASYGPRTAVLVGMIHGIGAETASQILVITAVGGAASGGFGVPMLFAFVAGLVTSNAGIVLLSTSGFMVSRLRTPVYVALGILAAAFSLWLGAAFLLGAEGGLPDLTEMLGGG
jgi:hypothetical protein